MRRHRPSGGIQMFSFLDAMVCTMGALLVLLHAFARHGEVEAQQNAEAHAATDDAQSLDSDRESLEWRIDQLKQSREKTESQLASARLQLSHVEDHERRLLERLDQLKIAAAELDRAGANAKVDRQHGVDELAATQEKIRQAQKSLEEARLKARQSAASYSVVPYDGPNSTRRRPIYIECRDESIILQPEGLELSPEDFAGFLGPGNPLASTLRSTREYWARQAASAGKPMEEPYPLLLVRPGGIAAYYAARSALDSWGSEFGYELVGADWQLKYPEADPRLAELNRAVLADARVRMRELALLTREAVKNRPRGSLHASSRGGFVPDRGASRGGGGRFGANDEHTRGWDSLGTNWARGKSSTSAADRTGGESGGVGGGYAAGGNEPGGLGDKNGSGGSLLGSQGAGGAQEARGTMAGVQGGSKTGRNGLSNNGIGSTASESAPNGFGGSNGNGRSGDSADNKLAGTSADNANGSEGRSETTGQPNGRSSPSGGSSTDANSQAGISSPGRGGSQRGSQGDSTSQSASNSSGGSTSSGSAGSQSPLVMNAGNSAGSSVQVQKTMSMAKSRGRDWGLPDAGLGTAAATRPILVECHNDRLVIVPENSNEIPKEIRLGPKAQDQMDEFVSDVWKHMKSWGTAGKGLYWRPTLLMDVKPGAADRYAEVKSLLADSGLDVRQRPPRAMAKPPNKKTTRR